MGAARGVGFALLPGFGHVAAATLAFASKYWYRCTTEVAAKRRWVASRPDVGFVPQVEVWIATGIAVDERSTETRSRSRLQNRVEQSGKPLCKRLEPQRVEQLFALTPRAQDARFAENAEVVRQR